MKEEQVHKIGYKTIKALVCKHPNTQVIIGASNYKAAPSRLLETAWSAWSWLVNNPLFGQFLAFIVMVSFA